MNLLTLPQRMRRTRPEPRHAAALAGPVREPAPQATAVQEIPSDETLTFRAPASHPYPLDEYPPSAQERIWAAPTPELLSALIDGLRKLPAGPGAAPAGPEPDSGAGLPAVLLRTVPRDGSDDGSAKEILSGWPSCEGIRVAEGSMRVAGICLGGEADVWVVLETPSAEWLDELIAVAQKARDALVYGGFSPVQAAAGGGAA